MERVGPFVLGSEMSLGEENRGDWVKILEHACWERRLECGEQGKGLELWKDRQMIERLQEENQRNS